MSLNLYKNLPKELIIIILNYDGRIKERKGKFANQINTNDEKYNLVKNNLLNNAILQNKLQLLLTNFNENNVLINTCLKDELLHKTIVQWFNLREVENDLYIININPPNRYLRPIGSYVPFPYY